MKNLLLLTAIVCLATSLQSCKKTEAEFISNDAQNNASGPGRSTTARAGDAGFTLGAASGYSVLGLNGTYVNLSNTTITGGQVGVGPSGSLNLASPSTIIGNLYLNTGVSATMVGHLNGTKYINQNLGTAVTDAIAASNYVAGLAPTKTFSTISTQTTITGNGGVNVINVGSLNLSSSNSLVLSGTAADYFIINVTGSFAMSGSAQIKTSGSATASHVFINFVGAGPTPTTDINNMINGTVLAVQRSVTLHGVSGQVICGGSTMTLMSGCKVNYIPFS